MTNDLENLDLRVCSRCEDDHAAEGSDLCERCAVPKPGSPEARAKGIPGIPGWSRKTVLSVAEQLEETVRDDIYGVDNKAIWRAAAMLRAAVGEP